MKWFLQTYRRDLIGFAAVVAVSAASYLLLGLPASKRAQRDSATAKALETQLASGADELTSMTTLISAVESDLPVVVGHGDVLPILLGAISELGERYGIEIVSVRPQTSQLVDLATLSENALRGTATRVSVAVVVKARYHALGGYLKSLGGIPILVAVRDLDLEKAESAASSIVAGFVIETYVIESENAQAQP